MRAVIALIVMINLLACAAHLPSDGSQTGPDTAKKAAPQNQSEASGSETPLKSPHGYIITKDYELGRFGGFIGDCADDQNWPYFWQCLSENSGNGGFK